MGEGNKVCISIVTACYNMAPYIEGTLRSVVDQEYGNLEYIVVDGASTDGTIDIVRKFEGRISRFISEPDKGQYHAIQKGLALARGEVMAWLNADDIYYPWTLSVVGEIFESFPDVDWIVGLPSYLNRNGQCVRVSSAPAAYPREFIRNGWFRGELAGWLQQESMFWRRTLWDKTGGLDLNLRFAADFRLWMEFAKHADLVGVAAPLAAFRMRPGEQRSSQSRDSYETEVSQICGDLRDPPWVWSALAKRSAPVRMLCQLALWKKCRVIGYSADRERWVLKTLRRPVSRIGLGGLTLERAFRGQGESGKGKGGESCSEAE